MNQGRADLAERMSAAARDLQGHEPQHTMDEAVRLAVVNVGGADAAGLSLVHRAKRVDSPAATADFVRQSDQLQNDLREGPCVDAIFDHRLVHSADLEREARWPRWASRVAAEHGIRSMMCFRLFTAGDTVGALNLYSAAPNGFSTTDRDDGVALAAHIAVAVASAQKIDQLDMAVGRRTTIGKAMGIMMERYGFDDEKAFAVMSRLSSQLDMKVFDVAEAIVRTRVVPQGSTDTSGS